MSERVFSAKARLCLTARSSTYWGRPARRATLMPYDLGEEPSQSLYRKVTYGVVWCGVV